MDIPRARCGPGRYHGARRMPWHREPMKDAASCDNPRRGAHPSTRGLRMGEPIHRGGAYPHPERIGAGEDNPGTETSKYPEERKSISRLPSSGERKGTDGQTVERAYPAGVPPAGLQAAHPGLPPPGAGPAGERNGMGGPAAAGDSPVREPRPDGATRSLSRAGHVKPGPNLGGPPSKPEYYPVTDSAPVP